MSELEAIVSCALSKAVADHDVRIIQYCLNHHAKVTDELIIEYIKKTNRSYGGYCEEPGFALLINSLPDDTMLDASIMDLCIMHNNSYYLRTVLATHKYHSNSINFPSVYSIGYMSESNINLLIQYGSDPTSKIIEIITEFHCGPLSRLINAGINLNAYLSEILKCFTGLYDCDPTFGKMQPLPDGYYGHSEAHLNVRNMCFVLIPYLKSNEHSTTHYLIVQHLISINEPTDISQYIWNYYISVTIGVNIQCLEYCYRIIRDISC